MECNKRSYVKKNYGTFGVEMRAYGQKLVQFCKHTNTRVSYSSIDYTSVHPLSNTNLIYIYMFILLYANCVVMYCVSFYVVVGNKLYLILSLSYLTHGMSMIVMYINPRHEYVMYINPWHEYDCDVHQPAA